MGEFEFVINTGGRNHSKTHQMNEAILLHSKMVQSRKIQLKKIGFDFTGVFYVKGNSIIDDSAVEKFCDESWNELIEHTKNDTGLGMCKRCTKKFATKDYNGHEHYVCDNCYDLLEWEFEDEYK